MDRPDIAGYLRAGWGLAAATVRYLPVGHDSLASAYEVSAGGHRYFLKVTRRPIGPAAVLVPAHLHGQGLTEVVAPLPTSDGLPWYRAGDSLVLLYPFVDGAPPAGPLTAEQWVAYGAFLAARHATALPDRMAALVPEEAYDSPGGGWLRELAGHARTGRRGGPWATALSHFWLARETEIAELADRADRLGRLARQRRRPHVLCHADVHTTNILVDRAGRLHVVDWDAPIRAPRERDLMFVTWALSGPDDEEAFRSGYGPLDLDPAVLTYYRYERLVADLAEFADVVLRRADVDDEARRSEYETFVRQFGPGGAVEQASTLDGRLR